MPRALNPRYRWLRCGIIQNSGLQPQRPATQNVSSRRSKPRRADAAASANLPTRTCLALAKFDKSGYKDITDAKPFSRPSVGGLGPDRTHRSQNAYETMPILWPR
jgi:hypothetical protein